VRKGAEKLTKFLHAKQQGRLDGFFAVKPKTSPKSEEKGKGKDEKKKGAKRKVGKVFHSTFEYTNAVIGFVGRRERECKQKG
jgi:hypothetical protein